MDVVLYKPVNVNPKPDWDTHVFHVKQCLSGNVFMILLLPGYLPFRGSYCKILS